MKRLIKLLSIIMILCLADTFELSATPGQLREDSICMTNGVYYGQHSADNHFHVASQQETEWYATGEPIYINPCLEVTETDENLLENEEINGEVEDPYNSLEENTNYSSDVEESEFSEDLSEEYVDEPPEISMYSEVTISEEETTGDLNKTAIINYLNIEVQDEEDGKIDVANIDINPSEIKEEDYGEHNISVAYTDSANQKIEQTGKIILKEPGNPPIINYKNQEADIIKLYSYQIPNSVHELVDFLDLKVIDEEDGELDITKDNIKINKEEKTVTISVKDSSGEESIEKISYEIIGVEPLLILGFILIILMIIGIIFLSYQLKKTFE